MVFQIGKISADNFNKMVPDPYKVMKQALLITIHINPWWLSKRK
jgi:hypothetical protein